MKRMINFFRNARNRLLRRKARRAIYKQLTGDAIKMGNGYLRFDDSVLHVGNGETVEIDGKTYTIIRGNFLIIGNVISSGYMTANGVCQNGPIATS